jgi:hypothetical protein
MSFLMDANGGVPLNCLERCFQFILDPIQRPVSMTDVLGVISALPLVYSEALLLARPAASSPPPFHLLTCRRKETCQKCSVKEVADRL